MANQRKEHNVEKYIYTLQRCLWEYGSIFICLAVVATHICQIPRYSPKVELIAVQDRPKAHMQIPISH